MSREKTNVVVKVLDLKKNKALMRKCLAYVKKMHPSEDGSKVTGIDFRALGHSEFGVVETPKGLFVVSMEGIVSRAPVSADHPLEILVYGKYTYPPRPEDKDFSDGTQSIDLFPQATLTFKKIPEELLKDNKEVNLAEFVRTFGSRLESNYMVAKNHLEKMLK